MSKNQFDNFLNIKCGYCGEILAVAIQEEIFGHNCFKHYNEKIHAVSIDDDFVVTIVQNSNKIIPKDTSDEHQSSTDHSNEMLINIVQTKPALWNFQIPLSERTKAKKKHCGGGRKYVRKTVSNLSDCDKAAGSAQEEDDFSILSTSTSSSTCESRPLSSTSTENSICESRPLSRASRRPSQTSTPITTSNTYSESLMSSALRDELKNVLNTPVPQKDAIDYFVACVSDGMRKLSRKKSRHLQIAILQLLAEAEEEEAKGHNF